MPACLRGGERGLGLVFGRGVVRVNTRAMSAYRPAFLHYGILAFLLRWKCGLGDRGCVAVAGKVEKYDNIMICGQAKQTKYTSTILHSHSLFCLTRISKPLAV